MPSIFFNSAQVCNNKMLIAKKCSGWGSQREMNFNGIFEVFYSYVLSKHLPEAAEIAV